MNTKRSLIFAVLFLTWPVGCKRSTNPQATAPDPTGKLSASVTTPTTIPAEAMTDDQLIHSNEAAGLGTGLRAPETTVKAGTPIPLRILFEDFAATTPIGGGHCAGLFFAYQNTQNSDAGGIDLSNTACQTGRPYPDSIALEKGKVQILDFTGPHALHLGLLPGTYLVAIRWDAAPVNKGGWMYLPAYANLRSNEVRLTVIH